MGLIEREETAYKCLCVSPRGGNPFLDTIRVQNVPYNPIKVEGGVLRRSGTSNRYIGEYNCNLNGCETYTLDVFNALDSIQYKVAKSWVEYTCLGRKL